MATLKSVFKLYNEYTRTADAIEKKTVQTTDKILKASSATDNFNKKLDATGVSSGKAHSGLNKVLGVALSLATAIKGINITDEYTNTAARLNLINDGMQTQLQLQDKIFAAANRSRGAYADMANAVAKMELLAGNTFKSNDETIAFVELLQKSFKVSGANQSEQSSALLQLTQAMASGKLQGDEFRSIMENAPMIAEAISRYTGKTKGQLKEMSAEGTITSDIIKNAMFAMSDDINAKFESMPKTFGDVWNKIKNTATRASRPLLEQINKSINSEKFDKFIQNVTTGFSILANAAGKGFNLIIGVYNFISDNWGKIGPIVEGAATAWLAYKSALLLVEAAQWAVNIATLANPIGLVILGVALLTAAIVLLWEKSEGFRKFWTSMWAHGMKTAGAAHNVFASLFNSMAEGQNKYATTFEAFINMFRVGSVVIIKIASSMAKAIVNSFGFVVDAIKLVIDQYNKIAGFFGMKTIDVDINKDNINKAIDITSQGLINSINGTANNLNGMLDKTKMDKMKLWDLDKFNENVDKVAGVAEKFTVSGWLNNTFEEAKKALNGLLPDASNGPYTVEGTGSGGSVNVNMDEEDLRYLRDIAERDYINKFSTATLAPNVVIQFGDVHETADVNALKGTLERMMREEIAVAAEGVYDV